jgi:hypothetical protein
LSRSLAPCFPLWPPFGFLAIVASAFTAAGLGVFPVDAVGAQALSRAQRDRQRIARRASSAEAEFMPAS